MIRDIHERQGMPLLETSPTNEPSASGAPTTRLHGLRGPEGAQNLL